MFIKNTKNVTLIRDGNRVTPSDFSHTNGFYFHRPKKNGRYGESPTLRFCDMNVNNLTTDQSIQEAAYKQFELYVRNPFPDTKTSRMFHMPIYHSEIHVPIDSFEKHKSIKLIAMNSDLDDVVYNGHNSNVMFEAETYYTTYTTGQKEPCTKECCNLKVTECGYGKHRTKENQVESWNTMPNNYELLPKDYIPDWGDDWESNPSGIRTEWEEYYQFQLGPIVFQCRIHESIGNEDSSHDTFGIMFRIVMINEEQQDTTNNSLRSHLLPVEFFLSHGLDITIPSVQCAKVTSTGVGNDITWEAVPTNKKGIDFRFVINLQHWDKMIQNIDDHKFRVHYVQHLNIINSNLRSFDTGRFQCTVLRDSSYRAVGGLITVTVRNESQYTMDEPLQQWIKIPNEYATYRELPSEFVLVPITAIDKHIKIQFSFKIEYKQDVGCSIHTHTKDPYRYYLDTRNHKKLPMSNIRQNDRQKRLVVDQTTNPMIKTVQTTYVGICRYSLRNIPKDGYINLTGYIPTPLNRERYEFWANGRFLREEVVILSPTTILLRNLKSLRNFEVIELVDDIDGTHNSVMRKGTMYIGLDGTVWSDYRLALSSNVQIIGQELRFLFHVNQHQKIYDYVPDTIIHSPNNRDIEEDILHSVRLSDAEKKDFDNYHNTPTLNGVPFGSIYLSTIGVQDIPQTKIRSLYDHHWKKETLTNPLFPTTHRDEMTISQNAPIRIVVYTTWKQQMENHQIPTDHLGNELPFTIHTPSDTMIIMTKGTCDTYFSLYISTCINKMIYEETYVKKIIPFIRSGVYVALPRKQYRGMYIHSTIPGTIPVKIL